MRGRRDSAVPAGVSVGARGLSRLLLVVLEELLRGAKVEAADVEGAYRSVLERAERFEPGAAGRIADNLADVAGQGLVRPGRCLVLLDELGIDGLRFFSDLCRSTGGRHGRVH